MPAPTIPFIITGTVYSADGSTVVANAGLKITNLNSGDFFTSAANAEGVYVVDCGNFSGGYANGEKVKIELDYTNNFSNSDFEYYVSIDAAKTWQLITHNKTYTTTYNKARTKIDTANYGGGRSNIDITMSA